uniref:Variant surface glycoprotein n=1 Tax=Trypanosoma brucei TaxID=5691 RepID=S5G7D0_9TRYP|nr:variant surface glycoprotein [Trypanosoma brucei]AGQ49909.1 variant surface glycoprotein [Trypanosoma brucei]AGQ50057.1 variant surface glycoprotein [Trypanosoma brucei]AGQ50093.1 variant surface glycoprotein [Trypanosoma brucei]AGQ50135.1 variant surface glycoprotein [Trypanosoma brucei]
MKKMKLLALIALLTLGAQTRYTAANKHAMKVSAFKALCELSGELKKEPAVAAQTLSNLLSQAQKYRDISVDLHILASQNETTELAAAAPIAFLAATKAHQLTQSAATLAAKTAHAAAAASYLSGFIDQTTSIFEQNQGSTDHCIATDSNAKHTGYAELAGCLTAKNTHPAITSAGPATSDLKTKLQAVGALNGITTASTSSNNCMLTSTQSGQTGYGGTTDQPTTMLWIGGIMSFGGAALNAGAFPRTASNIGQTALVKAATEAIAAAKAPEEAADAEAAILDKVADTTSKQTFTDFDTTEQRVGQSDKTTQHKIKGADLTKLAAKLKNYRDNQGGEPKLQKKRKDYLKTYSRQLNEVTEHCQPMECEVRNPTKAEESECNSAGGDKNKCKNLEGKGCTFNKESNKCELKKEMKTELEKENQAGTGEGAAGTEKQGVNCSKHTKKEDCEKENEGQKPGDKAKCGWIEEKCKDSSFLINKQFALSVVSAAFMALLF